MYRFGVHIGLARIAVAGSFHVGRNFEDARERDSRVSLVRASL